MWRHCAAVISTLCCVAVHAAPQTLHIGAVCPLFKLGSTGFHQHPNPGGIARLRSIFLAIKEASSNSSVLNGVTVKLSVVDSHADRKAATLGGIFLAKLGVDAIVGPAISSAAVGVAHLAAALHIPSISYSATSSSLSSPTYEYFVRTAPADSIQTTAMADILKQRFGWMHVTTVASTTTYGLTGIADFHDAATLRGITTNRRIQFDPVSGNASKHQASLRSAIQKASQSESVIFVLFCHAQDAASFFAAAKDSGLLQRPGITFFCSDGIQKLQASSGLAQSDLRGFFGIGPADSGTGTKHIYFKSIKEIPAVHTQIQHSLCTQERCLNVTIPQYDDSLDIDHYASYAYDAVWAVVKAANNLLLKNPSIDKWDKGTLLAELKASDYRGASGRVKFNPAGDRDKSTATMSIYNHDGRAFVQIGTWTESGGLSESSPVIYNTNNNSRPIAIEAIVCKSERHQLEGRHFKIATTTSPPFQMLEHTNKWNGFLIELLDKLAVRGKFTYALVDVGEYNWNGAGSKVAAGEADMFWGDFFVTAQRLEYVDFVVPYLDEGLSHTAILTNTKLTFDATLGIFARPLAPFTAELWLALLVIVHIAGLVVWLIEGGLSDGMFVNDGAFEVAHKPSMLKTMRSLNHFNVSSSSGHCAHMKLSNLTVYYVDIMWMTITSLCGGYSLEPRSKSGKFFAIGWSLFSIIIICSYTATLTAHLSKSSGFEHHTLAMMLQQKTKVCTYAGAAQTELLLRRYSQHFSQFVLIEGSISDMAAAVKRGDCTVMVDLQASLQYYATDACSDGNVTYSTHVETFLSNSMAAGVGMGTGFDGLPLSGVPGDISVILSEFRTDGTVDSLYKKWVTNVGCKNAAVSDTAQYSVKDLAAAMIMLAVFAVAGVISMYTDHNCTKRSSPKARGQPKKGTAGKATRSPRGTSDIGATKTGLVRSVV